MRFSLIICTYKRANALSTLLKSVQEQILYPDEIIVIDGSPDDETKLMLKSSQFSNLLYYKVDAIDRGLTKQRNIGISKASKTSEVVCFLDDDTILDSHYFKELLNSYIKYPRALAVGGYITNEVNWTNEYGKISPGRYNYEGWSRIEGSRFILRNKLGLLDNTKPGFMPEFSNGRSVSFLPPSGKIYEVEQLMGGVASYRKEVFEFQKFSTYFEGYGLYEDADFSLRLAKKGKLYINTGAQLEHHHDKAGRPNKFIYGKMVIRNGWYVWRVKHNKPNITARLKWNFIALLLTILRFVNVITTTEKKAALTEAIGRTYGWFTLIVNKPVVLR